MATLKTVYSCVGSNQQFASHVSANLLLTNRSPAEACCGLTQYFSPHLMMPVFVIFLASVGDSMLRSPSLGSDEWRRVFMTPSAFSKIQPINLIV